MITIFGGIALTFMMVMRHVRARAARPRVHPRVSAGCALSSTYGFLSGAWPVRRGRGDMVRDRAAYVLGRCRPFGLIGECVPF